MTTREFAKYAGIPSNQVSIYHRRGKIYVDETNGVKIIDPAHPINVHFVNQRKEKAGKKAVQDSQPIETITTESPETDLSINSSSMLLPELTRKKVAAEVEKKKEEIEKLKIDNAKKRGELIPTDLIYSLIGLMLKSVAVSFLNGADKMLVLFGHKYKMTNEESAKMKKELVELVNATQDMVAREAKKGVKRIVKEYSDQKGIGEHG